MFNRVFLIVALAVILVAAGSGLAEKKEKDSALQRAIIKVESITCGGCFSTINAGLSEMEGFSGIGANLFRKMIAVDFTAPMTVEKISEKLNEIGYPGKLETLEAVTEKQSFAYLQSKRSGFGSGGGCCSTGQTPVVQGGCAGRGAGSCYPSGTYNGTSQGKNPATKL